jgi:hypothetical protein
MSMNHSLMFALAFALSACAPAVPMENCSPDFRDQWWYIDQAVTDDHNLNQTCFIVRSDGQMETFTWDRDMSIEAEWTCTGTNSVRIKGYGSATFYPIESEDIDDIWEVDLNLTIPPIHDTSVVEPCWLFDEL